jgi:hypothetical protein
MFGDAEMKNLGTLVFDHEEHEQHLQADRRHGEEVNREDLADVILRKVFQCDGGSLTVRRTRDTVRSETTISSFCNSQ